MLVLVLVLISLYTPNLNLLFFYRDGIVFVNVLARWNVNGFCQGKFYRIGLFMFCFDLTFEFV